MIAGCSGDFGDAVYVLNVLKELPDGPHTLILRRSNVTKIKKPEHLANFERMFKPLAEAQPYVRECRAELPGDRFDWDSGEFRTRGTHSSTSTLMQAHVKHLNLVLGTDYVIRGNEKWLTVKPSEKSKDRIVINRTNRYRNEFFPWRKVVEHYGSRLLFVGIPQEAMDFSLEFGFVESVQVENLLEMAEIIRGSELFIGNQSVANAISEGLKHPTIQETSQDIPDCIYFRGNAQWVENGRAVFPDIGGSGELRTQSAILDLRDVTTHTTPPGGWQLPGLGSHTVFQNVVKTAKINGLEPPDGLTIEEWVKSHNAAREPEFFFGVAIKKTVEHARLDAGYPPRTLQEVLGL